MSHSKNVLPPVTALLLLLLTTLFGGACRPSEPEKEPAPSTAGTAPAPAPAPPAPPPPAAEPPTSDLGTDLAPAPEPAAPGPSGGPPAAADLPRDRPLHAGFLVVDGVYNSELAAPYDVFQHTVFHTKPGIEVFTVSPTGQPVTTFEGLRIASRYSFANAPPIDILVIPSARGSMDKDLQNQAMIGWVRQVTGQARYVVSLCDGAFVLGKAGLLDGVPATTFPEDYDRLVQMFPKVDLRVNVSFVDAGKILTSQGGARSYDVAMYLVDKLYGQKVAQGIGQGLLIPWPPDPNTTPRSVELLTPAPASP
jgi:transcriptional regulator GlxA family with amidase domain